MIRRLKFLLPVLFIIGLFSTFQTNANTDPKDKVLITILKYVLTEGHYEPQAINDAFSERVYESFLNKLDPSKRYFLKSDIDEFSAYKFQIDDEINNADLSFFYLVYNRFQQRLEESKAYYKDLLASKFNFDKKEILDVDYDKVTYAKNVDELLNVWYKQLKFSVISRVYDKESEQEDNLKNDASIALKTFDEIEKEARLATLKSMNEIYERYDELNYNDWFYTYINSITEEFDPHTTYFDPTVKKRFDISMAGKLEGIGARLQKKNDYTKVVELISGGPAWKSGELEVGDLILKVAQENEEPIDIVGMRLDDAIEYIKGKKGTTVRLTIKKVNGNIKEISIVRDVVELEETFVKSSVVEKDNRTFAVIDLPKFYIDFDEKNFRNSASDMAKEIERLKAQQVEGLVIDLRNNGGGSLQTAIQISGLFIDKGPVVQVKYRDSDPIVKTDDDSKIQWDGPLVVLVNELSASASEIFAAAMQDYHRAVIIGGKQTYGKGTVQSVLDLNKYHNLDDDLGALKMTIQKFYRINGSSTQLEGVHSDIMLPDRFSYMSIGERDLENPLKFDRVPKATYRLWNKYENFDQVINNSKKRIAGNSYFKLIDENATWLKKSQDDTVIHLDLASYKKELEETKALSEKFNVLDNYTTNLTYNSPLYEQELIAYNEDLADKRQVWHENLKKDIYIEEALNVLSELKLKSSYNIVKN